MVEKHEIDKKALHAAIKRQIEQRAQKFGLTFEKARDPCSVTAIGRLYLRGHITQRQYEAAGRFMKLKNDYDRIKGYPTAYYCGVSFQTNLGEHEFKQLLQKITKRYTEALAALCEVDRTARESLKRIVVEEREEACNAQSIASLTRALDCLAEHFGL